MKNEVLRFEVVLRNNEDDTLTVYMERALQGVRISTYATKAKASAVFDVQQVCAIFEAIGKLGLNAPATDKV